MAGVALRNVSKSFGAVSVIKEATLDVADGEFVVFVGPSGCGKSTLLRMIAGLESVTSGEILIGGKVVNDVEPADRSIAMVFQSYALYPHMSVRDNLSFGLRMNRNDRVDTERRVRRAAEILRIAELLDRRPRQLSGGQRQRVAIGRAIVREPDVFLFDEPLSNLDAELRVRMRVEISRLHNELGATMIYVTHDQVEAMTLADKIVVLNAGTIQQIGAPLAVYDDPANQFVAGFVGSPRMNFLSGAIAEAGERGATIALAGFERARLRLPLDRSPPDGSAVVLGVRPEHFGQRGEGDCDIAVHVDVTEHLGSTSYLYARSNAGEEIIIERPAARGDVAQRIVVSIAAARAYLFDGSGRRLR
jgi:lactose/L-arabinose transport system ATP-binding protein